MVSPFPRMTEGVRPYLAGGAASLALAGAVLLASITLTTAVGVSGWPQTSGPATLEPIQLPLERDPFAPRPITGPGAADVGDVGLEPSAGSGGQDPALALEPIAPSPGDPDAGQSPGGPGGGGPGEGAPGGGGPGGGGPGNGGDPGGGPGNGDPGGGGPGNGDQGGPGADPAPVLAGPGRGDPPGRDGPPAGRPGGPPGLDGGVPPGRGSPEPPGRAKRP